MGLTKIDAVTDFEPPRLQIIPLRAGVSTAGSGYYRGAIGSGYASALVWRFSLRVAGHIGTWVAQVDAHGGAIRSFLDDTKYARLKGGVYPQTDDQICPDGCEQANYPCRSPPLPSTPASGDDFVGYSPAHPPGTPPRRATSPYVSINDQCGPIVQSVTCSADIDLGTSGGTDCIVPQAQSENTHAARPLSFI
jgi:hypothetical protein